MKNTKKNVFIFLMVMILSCSVLLAQGITEQKENSINAFIADIEVENGTYNISVITENEGTLVLKASNLDTQFYKDLSDLKTGDLIEFIADENNNASYIRNTTDLVYDGLREVNISLATRQVPETMVDIVSYGLGYMGIANLNQQSLFVSVDYYVKGILDASQQNTPDFTIEEMYGFFDTYQTVMETGNVASYNVNRIFTSESALKLDPATEIFQQFSYAYGYLSTMQLISQIDINGTLFANGTLDGAFQEETVLPVEEIQTAFTDFQAILDEKQAELATSNLKKAEDFLATNKNAEGVLSTASGLEYVVTTPGEGDSPTEASTVTVDYELKTLDGTILDSSIQRNEKATFALTGVVPGFAEAVMTMSPGETITAWIHPDLGYGESGGQSVEPNSLLIFTITLYSFE
ncbi:MAG: FKBP-type peptidyl-prolyl cis-trans isomerase N-terminal domain-containing protein [Sphaerochaetaceae bacterium]